MKFVFNGDDGSHRVLSEEETREHMSIYQMEDAIEAKRQDPCEEVSYLTIGGTISVEL